MCITKRQRKRIQHEIATVPMYSHSIILQTEKTMRLYRHYCKELEIEPEKYFPISAEVGEGFFVWLRQTRRYTAGTLRTVTLNSLIRLNMTHTHKQIEPFILARIKACIRTFFRNPTTKKPSGGDVPLIPEDFHYLVLLGILVSQSSCYPTYKLRR